MTIGITIGLNEKTLTHNSWNVTEIVLTNVLVSMFSFTISLKLDCSNIVYFRGGSLGGSINVEMEISSKGNKEEVKRIRFR